MKRITQAIRKNATKGPQSMSSNEIRLSFAFHNLLENPSVGYMLHRGVPPERIAFNAEQYWAHGFTPPKSYLDKDPITVANHVIRLLEKYKKKR